MRRAVALATLLLAALAAPADGQVLVGGLPGTLSEARGTLTAPARVQGDVTVTFAGDPATCAAHGRCGEQGTVVFRPGRTGTLTLLQLRRGRQTTLYPVLMTGPDGNAVHAQVRRPGGRVCTDVVDHGSALTSWLDDDRRPFVGIPDEAYGVIETRCGGPLWPDVRAAMPPVTVPPPALGRGLRADLRGTGTFTAGGLTGALRSTVVVRTGRAGVADDDGGVTTREEEPAFTRWRVVRATGGVRVEQRVSGGAWCGALDLCGATASLALRPRVAPAGAELLFAGGEGAGGWDERGTLDAAVTRAGAVPCTDTAPLTGGTVIAVASGRTVRAVYAAAGARSRCGGVGVEPLEELATATLPRSALRGRRMTLRFDRGIDRTVGDVRTTTTSDLVIELVRR